MFKLKRFILTLACILVHTVFSFSDNSEQLEPLVITQQKAFFLNSYSYSFGQLEAFNHRSFLEDLNYLPLDLQSRTLGAGVQADFSLRGSTFSQVLVLLNGIRINDPQTAHHNSDIPFTKEDIDRIEVFPGLGSLRFGPDALGGAVNFKLKTPLEKKTIWEFAAGNQQSGYGLFSFSDKFKDLGFRVSLEDAQSEGFRYATDFKKFTAALSTHWLLSLGSWDNNFGYQEKEFGAYDFYTPDQGYPSREWTKTYLLNSSLSLEQESFLIKPNFFYRRHFDKFALDQRIAYYNDHCTQMFVPSVYLQKPAGLLGRVGAGLEWGQEKIMSTSLGKHRRQHQSVFLDDTLQIGQRWDLGLSWRLDDFSGFGQAYTGSANFKFRPGLKTAFNFGISKSLRIPSFTELYYNDTTTLGNAHLAAEESWNYQVGYKYEQEKFSLALVFFLRQEEQMIDWVRADPAQKWQSRNFTSGNVRGVEAGLHKKFNRFMSGDINYTYTDKSIDSQGYFYKYGPNYARHLVNTVFDLNLGFGRQEIGINYKKRPGRSGWLLLNAGLNYNTSRNSKIFLNLMNILNVEYQDIAGIPQAGRSIQAGLRLAW